MTRAPVRPSWTGREAERWLLSRELFGMRFGLDRMHRLLTALGGPPRFDVVHVVGTNGKSSTTRMTAAILAHHGLHTGSFLSPHLVSFTERIRVGDEDIDEGSFARTVARVAHAVTLVERAGADDDPVTQFEALTAAALAELAERGVRVAVVEAGLGGRYDATNVLDATVVVLTNVGLEHTRWLGPTVTDISREKLAVLASTRVGGATLVLGHGLHPDAEAEALLAADRHGARIVRAPADAGVALLARGDFQRRNFATARAAAAAYLGNALREDAVRAAAASTLVPGRFEVVDEGGAGRPAVVFDGAHNPAGAQALAEALPLFAGGRRRVGVISVLDDKDAAAMLATLLEVLDAVVLTTNENPRALSPATLASLARQVSGVQEVEGEGDPHRALRRGRELAGADGVVLVTGSIYLIADLLRPRDAPGASRL